LPKKEKRGGEGKRGEERKEKKTQFHRKCNEN
jgi:hypothetical protein